MSQFTIALCFFIAILAMAGTVLVLTIIYFFRQTSNRDRGVPSSGTVPAQGSRPPQHSDTVAPPVKSAQTAGWRRFFWNRKPRVVPAKQEKPLPAVSPGIPVAEAKVPPLKVVKPDKPVKTVKAKLSFWNRFSTGGRMKPDTVKSAVNTTVYDSAVVAATVSSAAGASPVAVKTEAPPKPVAETKAEPALKPLAPGAAAAAPRMVLPKRPVPVSDANIDLPPVAVKNMIPGTPARSEPKAETKPLQTTPPPAPAAAKPAPAVNNNGANDKNKADITKPVTKEIKPEMGNKDVKQPEKPAAEKAPAPPAVKPPASPAPAPAEAKKPSEFSSLGDLSKMFAKEVVDDSEATKLAKNMKDVEINDLLKNGHDIVNLLKRGR